MSHEEDESPETVGCFFYLQDHRPKQIPKMATDTHTSVNGWTAVPLDPSQIFKEGLKDPKSILVADIDFPDNELVTHVRRFAETHLSEPTLNHSLRVFYFGK